MPTTASRFLAGAFAALALASAASAQVLSYLTPIVPALALPAASTRNLEVPSFDPSLGTLTGVTLTFSGFATQFAKGENLGTASDYNFNVSSTFTLERASGPLIFTFGPSAISGSGSLQSFDGGYDFVGASAFDSGVVNTAFSGTYEVPESLLATYLGLVPIDFVAALAGSAIVSSSGNFLTQTANGAEGTLGVVYSYTPIPEPSTYALLTGLAVLGVTQLCRRRRNAI